MDRDLAQKIDLVISKINLRKNDLEHKLKLSTDNLRKLQSISSEKKGYRYYLERFNLEIMVSKSGIKKCELFIKRCLTYINYLYSLERKDPILSEKAKFKFIKAFQDEAIHDLNSRIEINDQKRLLQNITQTKKINLPSKEQLIDNRKQLFDRFIEADFIVEADKINSTYYLNYNTKELLEQLYPKK